MINYMNICYSKIRIKINFWRINKKLWISKIKNLQRIKIWSFNIEFNWIKKFY